MRHGRDASIADARRVGLRRGLSSRTLDARIAELRRKLEDDPSEPRDISTIWRMGYLSTGSE